MTTAINVLQAIAFSWALFLVLVLIGRYMPKSEPPTELVAAISGWPPPVLQHGLGLILNDESVIWAPPKPWTRVGA